ncbi:MAG: LemA family protein [Burkholderiales bacterium]|jgi:LemA protein|nr:LemA family protein [Burkholderiales bacterium]
MLSFIFGLIVLFIALAVVIIIIYNKLVAARNAYKNAFSQIDVQLLRRYDLIPSLLEGVKAYLSHEKETLQRVVDARNFAQNKLRDAAQKPGDASMMGQLMNADLALNSAIGRLLAVVEAYPDLKADGTIKQFNEDLSSTENRIAFARQAYNDEVMTFNTLAEMFPNNIVAQTFGFKQATLFESTSIQRTRPDVNYNKE